MRLRGFCGGIVITLFRLYCNEQPTVLEWVRSASYFLFRHDNQPTKEPSMTVDIQYLFANISHMAATASYLPTSPIAMAFRALSRIDIKRRNTSIFLLFHFPKVRFTSSCDSYNIRGFASVIANISFNLDKSHAEILLRKK